MHRSLCFLCIALFALGFPLANRARPQAAKPSPEGKLQFNRDIQPILSANCFLCHGPDESNRKAKLRLDVREVAVKPGRGGRKAIVPGDPKASELVARILSSDSDRMPPAESMKTLKESEKLLLQQWIAEGAEYQPHWAFVAAQRPAPPVTRTQGWAKNAIDHFVLARLEKAGLKPSPEADRYTLARRVAIDLTGLPPTLDMVDRFVNDAGPNAYETFVDQLLNAPTYGERWAQVWLDLARYADSNGFATDNLRSIWRYRDWVIGAINRNMPFDQFTIEQLAGDLLPKPTVDQLIATAFHRNTLTNDEGGTDDEEWRSAAVVDRVNTTMQVWMGVTMGCAQCHTHKYDPISHEEYYQLYGIFNQTEDSDKPDNRPSLPTPTPEEEQKKADLQAKIKSLEMDVVKPDAKLDEAQARWEANLKEAKLPTNIQAILKLAAAERSDTQKTELTKYYRSIAPELKGVREQLTALEKQLTGLKMTATPIMRELPDKKRVTKIHLRGNFLDLGKEVSPGVPAIFPALPSGKRADRLALAQWLVDPGNPLTARVAVNRHWEQIFGIGLVEIPEDWGIRGKLPSHPELLDWLATEFVAQKWDVKKLLRLIVTSATYRQSSKVSPDLVEKDPGNLLFGRGPRFRSTAEAVRDQTLFVSGLLSPKMFGAPVRPPRPKLGLTAAFGGTTDWEASPGDDKYRRALYTFIRRSSPYPSMATFDAPDRNVCTVKRPRTNTPLQALVTLNDPVFVEAAQALARRIVKEGGPTLEAKMRHGFRICLTRPPSEAETTRLIDLFDNIREEYSKKPKEAMEMATQPLGPLPPGMEATDLAAWTVVSNVLLNLDEMFSKR